MAPVVVVVVVVSSKGSQQGMLGKLCGVSSLMRFTAAVAKPQPSLLVKL